MAESASGVSARVPYSYRLDAAVPPFPDDKPLFVFDGFCVLCSGGARWLMRHDKKQVFRMSPAQSPVGKALYAHYGIALDETYLLISGGLPYAKSSGYLQMCRIFGGWWKAVLFFGLIPRALRDWVYDVIARNRYRWFGKVEYCELIAPEQKPLLVE